MEALIYLVKSFLVRPHKVVCPHEQINSCPRTIPMTTLAGLPSELLLLIFEFLPVVDLLCFALRNRNHRLYALSRKQLSRLHLAQDDEISVLRRLERDDPEYFACDFCLTLRRFDGSECFGLHELSYRRTCPVPCLHTAPWFLVDSSLRTHYYANHSPYRLSFLQIKLALKRFHYGPTSGVSTGSLGYTQVCHIPSQSAHPHIISLFSMEAQICPEPFGLYIRMQDILVVRTAADLVPDPRKGWKDPLRTFEICAHAYFPDFITPIVDQFQEGGKQSVSYVGMCRMCNTEYRLQIAVIDSKVTFIMTRWINLGTGLSPDDILWRAHIYFWLEPAARIPAHLITSPRQCFEDTALQSYKDLRSHNLAYLKNQQYKKAMRLDTYKDVYWVPYKESLTRRLYEFLVYFFEVLLSFD